MTSGSPADGLPPSEERPDPLRAARGATRPALPRRFFERAGIEEHPDGHALVLDGRPARTPGRAPLLLPTRALGAAVAAEWDAQGALIDPATMPLTRIANSAIDGVAKAPGPVVDDLARYAGSDLVCYRAGEPARLVAAQAAAWDPVLAHARERLDARFVLAEGMRFVAQPEQAIAAVRRRVEGEGAFPLAALHVMTTLTSSVLIALAVADGALSPEAGWEAAHADERYQESVWGEDQEASERRAARAADFFAAARFQRLAD